MATLNMDLQVGGAQVVIRLRGDVDVIGARDIVAVAEATTARHGLRRVVLDLSGVRSLSSAGLDAVSRIRDLGVERHFDVEVETRDLDLNAPIDASAVHSAEQHLRYSGRTLARSA